MQTTTCIVLIVLIIVWGLVKIFAISARKAVFEALNDSVNPVIERLKLILEDEEEPEAEQQGDTPDQNQD